MREAFHALLPDFGDNAVPAHGAPAAAPADGFVPFIGASRHPAAFDAFDGPHVDAPPRAPSPEFAEPDTPGVPGDAAALQTMLSAAFSADMAPAADGETIAGQAAAPSDTVVLTEPEASAVQDAQVAPPAADPELLARDERIAELTARIEALESAHAAEIARLVEQAVPAMADGVSAAVRSSLGSVLAHPLMGVIEKSSVDRFCTELATMVKAGEGVAVRLSGPERLLETVREGWPEGLAAPQMQPAETAELVAIADTAVLSTRLEEARALLFGGGR